MKIMNDKPESLPLSLFLPENLDLSDQEELGRAAQKEAAMMPGSLAHTGLARGLALAAFHKWRHTYDEGFLGLEEAIEKRSFNCMNETALLSLVGKILDGVVACVPIVETRRDSRDQRLAERLNNMHGSTALLHENGKIAHISNWAVKESIQPDHYPTGRQCSRDYRQQNPDMLERNGITQLRYGFDGTLTELRDEETKAPYDADHDQETFTFFCGEEGMKSYLNTIEKMSALTEKRSPQILPGQLMPRI